MLINAESVLAVGLIEKQSAKQRAAYKLIFGLAINSMVLALRRLSYLIKKYRPDIHARNPVPMAFLFLFVWRQIREKKTC